MHKKMGYITLITFLIFLFLFSMYQSKLDMGMITILFIVGILIVDVFFIVKFVYRKLKK